MVDDTFLAPLNASEDALRDIGRELSETASALKFVGLNDLAVSLYAMARDLTNARENMRRGRDMALKAYVSGAEQSTINMINAALSTASRPCV